MMEEVRALNNCEVFKQIRAQLSNYDHNEKKLSSFNYFSGNEREIRSLSQLVLNVLVEHELVQSLGEPEIDPGHKLLAEPKDDADAEQLRGAFMYLVLNTAHAGGGEQAEVLRLNPHCVHLLQQLPTQLPQLVTVSLALMCGLQPQLLEFLGCAPRWLSTQYHDSLNETLSHLIIDKQKQLPLICGVLNAVTQAICLEDHDAFIGYAVRLLQRHLLDSEERLSLLRTNARQRYLGAAMHQLLDVMLFNMEALAKPPTAPDYALVYTLRSAAVSIKQEPDVPGKLRNYANKLMDAVQRVLQQVSITTFMYWQELPSSRLLYKLQGDICLQAQQLLQLLAQDEILGKHKLCLQIQNFADAAQTFEERLEDLPLGELLELLDGDLGEASQSQLLAGLDQLLSRAIAMGSEECVETMAKHVHLLGYKHALMICEHLAQIVKFKQEQEEVEEENDFDEMYGDLLCDVLTPTFANCTIADQLKLLHKRDDLQLLKCFNFYMPDSNERRLEFFNNLRSDIKRLKLAQYLQFCWEMPVQTWRHLACLAASCPDYARLYWHLVTYCAPHAAKNVEATLVQILLNDRPHYNLEFPISLYETPVLLGGMQHYHVLRHQQRRRKRYRQRVLGLNLKLKAYTPAELQSMQNMYLDMCAAALEQFTTNEQWSALMRMLQLLQRLEAAEKRLFASSQRHWQHQRQQLRRLMQNKAPMEAEENARRHLKLANRYCSMHHRMGNWRQNHGTLFGQLIKSSDELRAARLQDFDVERLQLLDCIVEYLRRNTPHPALMPDDMREKLSELGQSLRHPHWFQQDQLKLTLHQAESKPLQPRQYAGWLAQASTPEAIKLMGNAIKQRLDHAVLTELATAADELDTLPAQQAYGFLLNCYMRAFNDILIAPAERLDYPRLIEHLIRTPKLEVAKNLSAAIVNFKKLLNNARESKIRKFIEQQVNK